MGFLPDSNPRRNLETEWKAAWSIRARSSSHCNGTMGKARSRTPRQRPWLTRTPTAPRVARGRSGMGLKSRRTRVERQGRQAGRQDAINGG